MVIASLISSSTHPTPSNIVVKISTRLYIFPVNINLHFHWSKHFCLFRSVLANKRVETYFNEDVLIPSYCAHLANTLYGPLYNLTSKQKIDNKKGRTVSKFIFYIYIFNLT